MSFVKVCPECGAEFVPTVELCFDCGATLTSQSESGSEGPLATAATSNPGDEGLPDVDAMVPIQTADLDWARELRELLAARGISSRLASDCSSCRPTLGVFVLPRDAEAARRVAHELYLEKVPEARETAFALPASDRCPACGAGVGELTTECPDCGLALLTAG